MKLTRLIWVLGLFLILISSASAYYVPEHYVIYSTEYVDSNGDVAGIIFSQLTYEELKMVMNPFVSNSYKGELLLRARVCFYP